eukprot:jgi/Bigna1/146186/aug1.110_g20894
MHGLCLTGKKVGSAKPKSEATGKKGKSVRKVRGLTAGIKKRTKAETKTVRKSIGKKKNSTIRSPVKKKKSPIKGKSTGKITQNIETQKAAAVQKQISPKHAEVTKGTVTIKWNHYTEEISFEVPPGIPLKTVDELFLASESYPNCTIHLQPTVEENKSETDRRFIGIKDASTYYLEIIEDPNQVEKELADAPKLRSHDENELIKRSRAANDITQQLRNMSTEEIRNQSNKFKQLKEARDLEDLMSGGFDL